MARWIHGTVRSKTSRTTGCRISCTTDCTTSRTTGRTTARFVLLTLCLVLLQPGVALSDGMFVWENREVDILEPEQKAFLFHDEGREDLVLSVKYEGAPADFGWIVPLPSVPEMFPEDSLLFSLLSQATQARRSPRSRRGGRLHDKAGVEVLISQQVGIYDTRIVEASAGRDLRDWLAANGYHAAPDAERILDRYIRDGWVFATLKIAPNEINPELADRLRTGTVPPIRFRFASPEPVFPLEITSTMSGGSEVLLYVLSREIRVPAVPRPESWENQINSLPGEQHWIYQYEQDARGEPFLPEYTEPFFLTKHRARFDPADMQDVRFAPYDPARGLRSASEAERLEAIAYLGRRTPDEAEVARTLLLEHLRSYPATHSETCSIVWALGELGGADAERVARAHAESPDPEIRIEAVEALGRMRARAAWPHMTRGLEFSPRPADQRAAHAWGIYRSACFDWLVSLGDSSCADDLRGIAQRHRGAERWAEASRPGDWHHRVEEPGPLALAALAACGDPEARRQLLDAIVTGGGVTAPASLEQAAQERRGTINGFPAGFWTGWATQSPAFSQWPALRETYSLFRSNPRWRTDLLLEAAADSRLPRTGVILLLANVDSLAPASSDRLMEHWRESIREPRGFLDVPLPSRGSFGSVRYNADACAIAYAFARHKRSDELERLWSSRPADDPVLEAEIVYSMAKTGDPRFREQVFGYVQRVWATAARSEAIERKLIATDFGANRWNVHAELRRTSFDLEYRASAIWSYLLSDATDSVRAFLTDRELPAPLRLAAMSRVDFLGRHRALLPIVREELTSLRASLEPGDVIALVADSLYSSVLRNEQLRSGRD